MIYVYAITDPRARPPAISALDGAPLESLTVGSVAAVYSAHGSSAPSPDPNTLRCHDAVLDELLKGGSLLPVRFGTTFTTLDDLAQLLQRQEERLARQLEHVEGCVELAVRVSVPGARPGPVQDGGDYLRQKLSASRRAEELLRRTLAPLTEIAVASAPAPGATTEDELRASYLVETTRVRQFAEEVERLRASHEDLALSCTGPWAPYSFVDGGVA